MKKVARKRMRRMMARRKTGKEERVDKVLGKPKKKEKKRTHNDILGEIRQLEYQRIMLPKRPSVRRSFMEDSFTAQLRTKYAELERLRQEEGRKATTETIIENLGEVFKKKRKKDATKK